MAEYPALRRLCAARLQSEIGSAAGWVALVLVAYDRLPSVWAVTLVLLSDFIPGAVLAPAFGALGDRCGRRRLAVAADVIRGGAFVALGLLPSFAATVALALVAGVGSAAFGPALRAAMPSLVRDQDAGAVMAVDGAVASVGWAVGPAVCACLLLAVSPQMVLVANGLTFLASAVVLSHISFGTVTARGAGGFTRDLREGFRATAGHAHVRLFVVCSAAVALFAAIPNVIKPLFALETLGAGSATFALMATVTGIGAALGSLWCAGTSLALLPKTFSAGLGVLAIALLLSGAAPTPAVAALAYTVGGVANGLIVCSESRYVLSETPERILGRVFGIRHALMDLAFIVAFLLAGVLPGLVGIRGAFYVAAAGAGLVATYAAVGLTVRRAPNKRCADLDVGFTPGRQSPDLATSR